MQSKQTTCHKCGHKHYHLFRCPNCLTRVKDTFSSKIAKNRENLLQTILRPNHETP